MDSFIIQFIVNSIFPWLIFSGLVYVCSSYITKHDNTSPSIWWSALLASFLPFIPLSLGTINIPIPDLDYISSSLENAQIVKQASITHVSLQKMDLVATALIAGYFGFTSLKLVKLLLVWQKLKSLTRSSELINELSTSKVEIVISSQNHSPFVIGITTPYVVLPHYFSSLNKDQQSILIQHELTHITNKDHITILLWRVLCIVLWINPFVKKMEWQFIRAMEHRCDRHTICRFNLNKHDYAKALLQSLKKSIQFGNNNPVAQFSSAVLCADDYKARLSNIASPSSKSKLALTFKFSLMILVIFSLHTFLKDPAMTGKLTWQHPLNSHTISSTFRSISKVRDYKPHRGIDYVAQRGSPVLSAADGIIVVSGNKTLHSNYGNTVLIQHKSGYQTLYAHLESSDAKVGSWVKAGQVIGIIGDTGKTTGVHLHFEVIKDNQRVDPSLVLGAKVAR
ncbi:MULTISPECIES: peptidoglycan DD-metalloendopeptidase family protein [unclassified Pseudoalteromonas]|uniref:peptidoglycan DD-metalloendopeptidase family protein n=1 Tax=unclassified Pseudoalteromonas TaxID=194690 RepID=UPI00390C50A5|nr:M23/M56 family metallopeptidase [Ningiella sp. W23]